MTIVVVVIVWIACSNKLSERSVEESYELIVRVQAGTETKKNIGSDKD